MLSSYLHFPNIRFSPHHLPSSLLISRERPLEYAVLTGIHTHSPEAQPQTIAKIAPLGREVPLS